jgi:hypothetical protein
VPKQPVPKPSGPGTKPPGKPGTTKPGKFTAEQATSAIKMAKIPKSAKVSKKVVAQTVRNISTGSLGATDTKALKKALGGGASARAIVQGIRREVRGKPAAKPGKSGSKPTKTDGTGGGYGSRGPKKPKR